MLKFKLLSEHASIGVYLRQLYAVVILEAVLLVFRFYEIIIRPRYDCQVLV